MLQNKIRPQTDHRKELKKVPFFGSKQKEINDNKLSFTAFELRVKILLTAIESDRKRQKATKCCYQNRSGSAQDVPKMYRKSGKNVPHSISPEPIYRYDK